VTNDGDFPRARPVDENAVPPEAHPWASPRRVLVNLAVLIVVWIVVALLRDLLHLPLTVIALIWLVGTLAVVLRYLARSRRARRRQDGSG
jgi:Flp pilus assembly protein TadB